MNADVLTTRAADGIAVIALGSANASTSTRRWATRSPKYWTDSRPTPTFRVVIVTGGAPGYFKGRRSPRRPAVSRSKKGETYG